MRGISFQIFCLLLCWAIKVHFFLIVSTFLCGIRSNCHTIFLLLCLFYFTQGDIPYMHNLKRNDTNELTKKRLKDLENELMVARQKSGGSDSYRVWDGHVHTAVFNNKDLLYSTGNSA